MLRLCVTRNKNKKCREDAPITTAMSFIFFINTLWSYLQACPNRTLTRDPQEQKGRMLRPWLIFYSALTLHYSEDNARWSYYKENLNQAFTEMGRCLGGGSLVSFTQTHQECKSILCLFWQAYGGGCSIHSFSFTF